MIQRQDHLKKMEIKKQHKLDAGVVSDIFPNIEGIVIHMIYFHNAENPILMQRRVNVFPSSYAFFKMECMIKGCEGGGFDLTSLISKNIKQHKKSFKGEMVCKGKNGGKPSDHAKISYEINIKYSKKKLTKKV